MRKIYSMLFVLGSLFSFIPLRVTAQNKLIKEDRTWEYYNYKGNNMWLDQFCFDGTQEIEGKTYNQWKLLKRISWTTAPETAPVESDVNEVSALLREEEGKVYMLFGGEKIRSYDSNTYVLSTPYESRKGQESLLYDFTVSTGESFPGTVKILWAEEWTEPTQTVLSDCVVMETGVLDLTDTEVKKFILQSDVSAALVKSIGKLDMNDIDRETVIDGDGGADSNITDQSTLTYAEVVGNIGRGNMTSLMPSSPIFLTSGIMDYHVSYLSSVFDADGTIIYGTPSGVFSPDPRLPKKTEKIYDLHGREVSAPVPGSIYIREGKKFVAR
ncbi:MAG: hypothetical protein K2G23_02315 [Muribaculaceae bacterium]|nr:hypothetical protein [Muribaculaceae bacterium]